MENSSAFKLSANSRPLYPLSPERIHNAGRIISSTTSATKSNMLSIVESQNEYHLSPQSSPTRRVKNSLFVDTDPLDSPSNKLSGFALPLSPSLPEFNALRGHSRTNSDVQGLVKRFEHLDVRDRDAESAERRRKHEAELRRAQIAREEAESDVKRLREEARRLKKEKDEGLDRERKVGKRLEVVMEEFVTYKEANSSQSSVYEKELRRARKEAFKSSSAVVKLQEELKATRASLRVSQSNLDMEKQKLQRKEQERFEMEYQLIPLQEQLEKLKSQLKCAEEERNTLKKSLKEEELTRIASEGMIALPTSQENDDDLLSPGKSPRRRSPSLPSEDKENRLPIKKSMEIRRLMDDLHAEKMRRRQAEDLTEFLRLECMFRCCSCKTASLLSRDFALRLDGEIAARVEMIQAGMAEAMRIENNFIDDVGENDEVVVERGVAKSPIAVEEAIDIKAESILEQRLHDVEDGMDLDAVNTTNQADDLVGPDSPSAQLIRKEADAPKAPHPTPVDGMLEQDSAISTPVSEVKIPLRPETPSQHNEGTPFRPQPSIRTVTTTTTIPMHFTPIAKPALPLLEATEANEDIVPASAPPKTAVAEDDALVAAPTFDRAAALAAIEYRRGRARSFATGHATPRKQMIEGVRERRDISAPVLGQKAGGSSASTSQGSVVKRAGSAGRQAPR